jgi:hypothetical protein
MLPTLLPLALALSPFITQADAKPYPPTKQALYLLSNEVNNEVIALPIRADGTISAGRRTSTKGAGSISIDGKTMMPAVSDALVSQSALTVAGNNLFAVNAGSNTLAMFTIDPVNPTKLRMVGEPLSIPGEFPTTVAASKEKRLVCVGTTGAVAGVSCASFSKHGMSVMDDLRPFDLQQSTPPVGPPNTVSHVFFSDDQETLFVTVKGDPGKNNTGFLASFPVENGSRCEMKPASVSSKALRHSPDGTAVLFGSVPIPGTSDILVTDASFGAALLSVDKATGTASVKGRGEIDGQAATCWSTYSPATDTVFVTDVGVNRLVEVSAKDASIVGSICLTNGDPGLIDLRAAGDFVYALSPGNGTTEAAVTVVNVKSKKEVQHFSLGKLGVGRNSMGMSIFQRKS